MLWVVNCIHLSTVKPYVILKVKNAWLKAVCCVTDYGITILVYITYVERNWRSWLRHCATSQKVAGSIPDGVTLIFH